MQYFLKVNLLLFIIRTTYNWDVGDIRNIYG